MAQKDDHIDNISRERIDSIREEIKCIQCDLASISDGLKNKAIGDVQIATKLDAVNDRVFRLEEIIIFGNNPVTISISEIKTSITEINRKLEMISKESSDMKVAGINRQASNWKAIVMLIGSIIASLSALAVALVK
jgi:hypothetical protein